MTVKRIEAGPRISQAVVHGNVVYSRGQVCPADAGADARQTKAILGQIQRLLAEAGRGAEPVVRESVKDIGTFGEMNEVWDKWVALGRRPHAQRWKRAWRGRST